MPPATTAKAKRPLHKQGRAQRLALSPVRAASAILAEWRREQERVRRQDDPPERGDRVEPPRSQTGHVPWGLGSAGRGVRNSLADMLARGGPGLDLTPEGAAALGANLAGSDLFGLAQVKDGYAPGHGLVPVASLNGGASKPLSASEHGEILKQLQDNRPSEALIAAVEAKGMDKVPHARIRAYLRAVGQSSLPHLFTNPLQDVDYRLYETMLKHTFIGPLARAFVKYLMGKGFEPSLALVSPSGDEDVDQKELEAGQEIVERLKRIDAYMDGDKDAYDELDTGFQDKMVQAITSMLFYNRSALIYDWDPPTGGPDGWEEPRGRGLGPEPGDEKEDDGREENGRDNHGLDEDDLPRLPPRGKEEGEDEEEEPEEPEEPEEGEEEEEEEDGEDEFQRPAGLLGPPGSSEDSKGSKGSEDSQQGPLRRDGDRPPASAPDPIGQALYRMDQAGEIDAASLALTDGEDRPPRRDFELDGKSYPEVPHRLIFVHARDLGMIRINPRTRALRGVRWANAGDEISVEDMLYFWNPVESAAIHNSQYYGMSILTPLVPPAKIMRQLVSDDFPAIATATWARMYLLVAKNEGGTPESKQKEWEDVTRNLRPGTAGVLIKSPEDVNLFDLDFDPKVQDLIALLETMIRLTISMLGLPQAGFHDEAAANRATMAGKLELNKVVNIEPIRRVIARPIERQWYGRWFRMLYADSPALFEKYKIEVKFSDIEVAEWYDTVQAVLSLDQRKPLKDEALGHLTGLDNYQGMIDLEQVEKQEQEQKEMQMQQMQMQAMQGMGGGGGGKGGMPPGGKPSFGGMGGKAGKAGMPPQMEGVRPGDQDSPSGPGDKPGGPPSPGGASPDQQRKAFNVGGIRPGKQGKAGKLPGGSRSFNRPGGSPGRGGRDR